MSECFLESLPLTATSDSSSAESHRTVLSGRSVDDVDILVRLPSALFESLAFEAEAAGRSLRDFIVQILADAQ